MRETARGRERKHDYQLTPKFHSIHLGCSRNHGSGSDRPSAHLSMYFLAAL